MGWITHAGAWERSNPDDSFKMEPVQTHRLVFLKNYQGVFIRPFYVIGIREMALYPSNKLIQCTL